MVSADRGGRQESGVPWRSAERHARARKEHSMMDAIMLAIGLVFFALSVGYVVACDRL
jgi:hypothetical protein